jgi:hypothetical protein
VAAVYNTVIFYLKMKASDADFPPLRMLEDGFDSGFDPS